MTICEFLEVIHGLPLVPPGGGHAGARRFRWPQRHLESVRTQRAQARGLKSHRGHRCSPSHRLRVCRWGGPHGACATPLVARRSQGALDHGSLSRPRLARRMRNEMIQPSRPRRLAGWLASNQEKKGGGTPPAANCREQEDVFHVARSWKRAKPAWPAGQLERWTVQPVRSAGSGVASQYHMVFLLNFRAARKAKQACPWPILHPLLGL